MRGRDVYENIVYRDLEKDPLAARMGFFRGADPKAVRTRAIRSNVFGWKQRQISIKVILRERKREKEDRGDI